MKQIFQGLILCLSFLGFACSGDVMHKPLPDEKQLDEAIQNEDYERAARLRDEISKREKLE